MKFFQSLFSVLFVPAYCALALTAFTRCSQSSYPDRSTHIVDSVDVSKVWFWPPGLRYIATSESVVVELNGLQRGYTCAAILESGLKFATSHDTTYIHPQSRVELPDNPSCPLDLQGLDTSFRVPPFSATGLSILTLKTLSGTITDSAHLVTAMVNPDSFAGVPDTAGRIVNGRFTFQNIHSTRTTRSLISDSSLRCETLQGAVFTQSGDTLKIRFHRLLLDSIKHATLNPCLAKHRDSINVASDVFGFPRL